MCGALKIKGKTVIPGQTTEINTGGLKVKATWGVKMWNELVYNARKETWEKPNGCWKDFTPCSITVDGFQERNTLFFSKHSKSFDIMALRKKDNFVVLTQPANKVVGKVHHRMPVVKTA